MSALPDAPIYIDSFEILAQKRGSGLRLILLTEFDVAFIEFTELVPYRLDDLAELLQDAERHGFSLAAGGLLLEDSSLFDDGFGDRVVLISREE